MDVKAGHPKLNPDFATYSYVTLGYKFLTQKVAHLTRLLEELK